MYPINNHFLWQKPYLVTMFEHELITMEGQGHGFDGEMDNPTVRDAFTKVLAFLERHTSKKEA